MADEGAELVGGIQVSVGASNQKLVSDLEQANRLLDQWANRTVNVRVGAQFVAPAAPPAAQRAQQTPTIKFGAGAATAAQGQQGQTALQRAINAELAKTGELYDSQTGEIVAQTQATRQQRQAVADLQSQASKPTEVNFDTADLQKALDQVLATLKEIAAEAANVAKVGSAASNVAAETAGGGGGGVRSKVRRRPLNARDIGVTPDSNRVYTFDPEVYARQDQEREAARRREAERYISGVKPSTQAQSTVDQLFQNVATTFAAQYEDSAETATRVGAARARQVQQSARRPQPVDQAAAAAQRREEEERLRNIPRPDRYRLPEEIEARGVRGGGGAGGRRISNEEIERQAAERLAVREATQVSAGRTARTGASSLGSFLFGGGRERIQAEQDLQAAVRRRVRDERDLADAEKFARSPDVIANERNRRDALDEVGAAQERVTKSVAAEEEARKRVASFASPLAGARNLLAVTAAGAAFGVGLEAINVALKAGEKAAAPYFDQMTGYAQKTADLTSALADQARQQQGNAQAVVAIRLAQQGFSQQAAASIQPLIQQRVEIEAGNKALVEQIETFREAENLRRQGANAGLGGGTGGVLGTSIFATPGTGEQVGNFLQGLGQGVQQRRDVAAQRNNALAPGADQGINEFFNNLLGIKNTPQNTNSGANLQQDIDNAQSAFNRGLALVNSQLAKGGDAAAQFQQSLDATNPKIEQTAQAFDSISPEMAKAIRDQHLYSDAIAGSGDAIASALAALRAIDRAGTIIGPQEALAAEQLRQQQSRNSVAALRSQFAFERPAILNSLERQQQQQLNVQIPAQAALANLANPLQPVATGIVGRNAAEQAKINGQLKEAQQLQDGLNTYYQQGYDILRNTYQIPQQLLGQIKGIGQEIANTQAGIANEQAQYQVAQFNFQLQIARRTLGDISGLTGHAFGVPATELGTLERANLLLGRQAQGLQFALSQRQINFQNAVAGFQVPGLTPAEQNARVEEAKTETSFAQKQLDIQREMFRNQVKIVDIGNLRQGQDLVRQISLLLRGREVAIDTQAAQAKLSRLQAQQQILVQQAGTYIQKVDAQVSAAMSEIEALEKATGHAISAAETQGVAAAYRVGQAFFLGITGGGLTTNHSGGGGGAGGPSKKLAGGGVFDTMAPTRIGSNAVMGEAGGEKLLVLSHPQAASGFGGGGNTYVTFGDVTVKTEADFQRLYRMVLSALGRDAATKGLRTPF